MVKIKLILNLFKKIKGKDKVVYIRNEAVNDLLDRGILKLEKLIKECPDKKIFQGRGETVSIPIKESIDNPRMVIRHYHHGGIFRKLLKDIYWGIRKRPFQELLVSEVARKNNLNTPLILAIVVQRWGYIFYQADIITQEVEDSINAYDYFKSLNFENKLAREKVIKGMADSIKKMHEVGVYHKDLNLKNILIQNKENQIEIFIIDFDKACLKKRLTERQRKRNLLRLNRSVEKLEKETPLMTREDKVVFLNQYYKDKEDKEETIKKIAGFSISEKLTIAHFISLRRRAGVEKQFINYITNKSSRFNHIVIGNGINEEYKRYLEKIKIKTIYFKEEVPLIGKSYYLATILKKFQVNCLISYNYLDKAYIPLSLAFFRKKDRPCLVHYELGRGWHRRKRDLSVSLFKLLAKGYFVVSKDSQIMLDNLGIKKEKIRIIYNMFYNMTNTNSKAFSKEETSQVGYLGRLDTIKGVHCLPEVFLTIWEMNSKVRFHLAGDGDLEEWLRNEFHKKGILNKVTFHGNIKDPQEVMKRCSLILIPSLADTFPIIALEAASLKLPVVATSVGGLPEIIEDGLNGFLVFPTIPANIYLKKIEVDLKKTIKGIPKKVLISGRLVSPAFAEPKELARAAVKILNDPEKAKEMGEKGYQMVQKFSQEVYIRNFEENIFNLFFERDSKC